MTNAFNFETAVPLPQACQRLGLSRHLVLARVCAGELQGRQLFGRWLIDAADLQRAVDAQHAGATAIAA